MTTHLKYWRKRRYMSVRMLEKESGVNRNTIINIEKGEHTPYPATLHKLADALKITVDELVEGEKEKPASRVA